ncbi:MAG: hypothetical protein ABEH60_06215 [Halonotius sp.]
MVEGTDTVAVLPSPVGKLTYNEWHALVMGALTAVPATVAVTAAHILYRGGPSVAAVGFGAAAFAYVGVFTVLATAARFLDGVPVLREAWYFLATHMTVVLLAVVVPIGVGFPGV